MKRTMKLWVMCIGVLVVFQSAQVYSQENRLYNPEKKFTVNQLKEDFLKMRESLEKIHVGAAASSPELRKSAMEVLNVKVASGYGSVEGTHCNTR